MTTLLKIGVWGSGTRMLCRRFQGCSLLLLLLVILSNASGSLSSEAEEAETGKRRSLAAGAGGLFCVAIQSADPAALQRGLNYACGPGRADCSAIQPGGVCYKQNNLPALASYAYNDYYHRNAATGATCSFDGTATTTPTDPSSGQCIFAGSSMAGGSNSTTPAASAPSALVPPSSTFTPGIGGGPGSAFTPYDAADSAMAAARRALLLMIPLVVFLFS
ncbi:glucan endo-1,3-beta-glucosidase 4 isoform X1 [Brachypodium distachyon]|uniref:glucan endo-1,3-beta-glucosidase 4 isoform X1 n=1 Tax=Brachypodium distachyon TaxID=15368 RepID=UPI00052FECA7|nr:glucan endo-1,3-beta-glucosidase 4 isoform X1 [Brachypodium distachyon]|eukprot:XP_003559919.2 glucan endo-1,3-beta-glucosidase 4 isoform X1 [Brachypodium distachyon]